MKNRPWKGKPAPKAAAPAAPEQGRQITVEEMRAALIGKQAELRGETAQVQAELARQIMVSEQLRARVLELEAKVAELEKAGGAKPGAKAPASPAKLKAVEGGA